MNRKAESIREALIDGASRHKVAERVVKCAQKAFGESWAGSAIIQISLLFRISIADASALVSEHCTKNIRS